MRTVELFQRCPQVSEYYRHKFRYIFVDEYQDTNHAQYVLVRELSGIDSGEQPDPHMRGAGRVGPSWITVVGDSDQSIYAFRGADIRNIQDFEQDFPNAKTIMLEQNYRSTQTILDAANAVIARNENRKPKKLWTALGEGDKIVGYAADNAQQEAGWIANEIARIHNEEGVAYRDIAIMYRANAQSRSLEEAMINANLPYQLVGGTKFYERREIKDALAYLQAIVNPADNVNVRRILNVPKRGLGVRAEGLVASYADAHGTTFFEAIEHMEQIEGMSTRTTKPLSAFRDMMHELAAFAKDHDTKPSEVVAEVLAKSGILEELQRSEDPQDASRVDNLSQLQSVAAEFEQNTPDATLAGFLETTALVADSDQLPGENEDSGKVTMMTLHTAKGLEYPYVFLTGMEQGTFPHQRAMEDTSELAEERRLAYVGITRAKRRLYVTRAAVRAQWGQASDMMPSQFLDEIPDELIDWKRREAGANACVPAGRMTTTSSAAGTMMTISDRCHSAVPRMESRIMVPHTVPARGGLVPHTDRLHMGQGARSTAARLRRAHHPRMVPHPGARAEDREPVPHTARMVRMAPASQEGNRARSPRDVSSRKTSLWI